MENLNAEQIKKALECCTVGIGTECENCPYMLTKFCNDTLKKNVLALITSQEQRIKELEKIAEFYRREAERLARKLSKEGENENT